MADSVPPRAGAGQPLSLASAHDELMQRMHEEVQEDVLRQLAEDDMKQRAELTKRKREQASAKSVLPLVIQYDMLRDSLVRFLGYANELGESFRPFAPQLVMPSYAVAWTYVAVDTADKAWRAHRQSSAAGTGEGGDEHAAPLRAGAAYAVDTLLWQGMASVLIPGYIINRYVTITGQAMHRLGASGTVGRLASTAVGLLAIPFIVEPLDEGVHMIMDRYVRPKLGIMPHVEKRALKRLTADASARPQYAAVDDVTRRLRSQGADSADAQAPAAANDR